MKPTICIDIPCDDAEDILIMLRPIIRACMWAPNIIETVALSAYLQGAVDSRTNAVESAIQEYQGGDTCPSI